jgi:hypothetical protein
MGNFEQGGNFPPCFFFFIGFEANFEICRYNAGVTLKGAG